MYFSDLSRYGVCVISANGKNAEFSRCSVDGNATVPPPWREKLVLVIHGSEFNFLFKTIMVGEFLPLGRVL